ncbi:MAG: tRNA (adenosine(37)-N6)-threonylcarbamoyltransferase complex ATPase subunit type 1 TsaE [Alphaproteobacteria bacterium]|nr:tRNA (adenosine(37)-N6)-threonylcarbamoyltransferase complex ATPase subunit type 1 TsaE [Alphaproteobacteria bacterium]
MTSYIFHNENEMILWAKDFAKALNAPVVIALHGDLGIGKTTIARAIINELCGDTIVPSPTFTIVQEYDVTHYALRVTHYDLYRIKDKSELVEIGLMDAIANNITIIEWPEIAMDILPKNTIHIYIGEFESGRKLFLQ